MCEWGVGLWMKRRVYLSERDCAGGWVCACVAALLAPPGVLVQVCRWVLMRSGHMVQHPAYLPACLLPLQVSLPSATWLSTLPACLPACVPAPTCSPAGVLAGGPHGPAGQAAHRQAQHRRHLHPTPLHGLPGAQALLCRPPRGHGAAGACMRMRTLPCPCTM